jgi:hypothetical protein
MRSYSPFFQTLHDESSPIGNIGRGTHYSVFRAVVFHDHFGDTVLPGRYHDFAVIWDEDHDERSINVVEAIYLRGLLSRFVYFGERKGFFTAVLIGSNNTSREVAELKQKVDFITQQQDDPWSASTATLAADDNHIIQDHPERCAAYLSYIDMLWELGPKTIHRPDHGHKQSRAPSRVDGRPPA